MSVFVSFFCEECKFVSFFHFKIGNKSFNQLNIIFIRGALYLGVFINQEDCLRETKCTFPVIPDESNSLKYMVIP